MSIIVPAAPADALGRRLPLSARAASGRPAESIGWSGSLPPLPTPLTAAVSAAWGVTVSHGDGFADPLSLPGFAAAFAQTRADQIVRAFSRRTNLVVSGSTTAVVGDGPVADAVSAALSRIGSRVVRVADSPVARLRAHLAGVATTALDGLPAAADRAHYVVATGEGHDPLDPAGLRAVLIDASVAGTGVVAAGGAALRAHVRGVDGGRATIVDAPPTFPADLDAADGLAWRLADLVVALSLCAGAARGDLATADDLFAAAVIA